MSIYHINEKKKIHFRYFTYDTHKRRVYRDTVKVVSPYALAWDDNKYFEEWKKLFEQSSEENTAGKFAN